MTLEEFLAMTPAERRALPRRERWAMEEALRSRVCLEPAEVTAIKRANGRFDDVWRTEIDDA